VTAALLTTSKITEAGTAPLCTASSRAKIETVFESFGNNDVPDDNERYFVVSPAGWIDLLTQEAFSNADYIGTDELPFKGGMTAKRWLGFMWTTFSGLPTTTVGGNIRRALAFHKTSVGHASGQDVKTDLSWVAERHAHFYSAAMSQGAVLIDAKGCFEVQYAE
jgi:hypothetical protein